MQQILYTSSSTVAGDKADLYGILEQSRHNNAIDGVTGLLWSDGIRFLQVFEGPKSSVYATALRIWADRRHCEIDILREMPIEQREFGGWNMVHRHKDDLPTIHDAKMRRLLTHASHTVSQSFYDLIAVGKISAINGGAAV